MNVCIFKGVDNNKRQEVRWELEQIRNMFLAELHEHAAPRYFNPQADSSNQTMGPVHTPRESGFHFSRPLVSAAVCHHFSEQI